MYISKLKKIVKYKLIKYCKTRVGGALRARNIHLTAHVESAPHFAVRLGDFVSGFSVLLMLAMLSYKMTNKFYDKFYGKFYIVFSHRNK